MVDATKCEHGKRIGRAGIAEKLKLPWSGMFCPDTKCEPIFFLTKEQSTTSKQYIFHDKDTNQYYLIDIYNDTITLKVKHNGWSDTWSLPLAQVRGLQ